MSEQVSYEQAKAVKDAYLDDLLSKPNVVGCGIGFRQVQGERTNEIVVVVMVTKKVPNAQLDPDELIPRELEGVPIDVQEVGELGAL